MDQIITELRFIEREGKRILQMRIGHAGTNEQGFVIFPLGVSVWHDVPLEINNQP